MFSLVLGKDAASRWSRCHHEIHVFGALSLHDLRSPPDGPPSRKRRWGMDVDRSPSEVRGELETPIRLVNFGQTPSTVIHPLSFFCTVHHRVSWVVLGTQA